MEEKWWQMRGQWLRRGTEDDNGGEDLYDWCRVIWAEACVAGGGGTRVYLHQVFVQVALFHQKNMYLHQRW